MTDIRSTIAKTAARKSKRASRAQDNAALVALGGSGMAQEGTERPGSGSRAKTGRKRPRKPKSPTLSKLKKALWLEMSLLVRSWSPVCLACKVNPTECAGHVVPANSGGATAYFLLNLIPMCFSCNGAELRHRGEWVYKFKEILGDDVVDALYLFNKESKAAGWQFKKWWVLEQTERIRRLRTLAEERVRAALSNKTSTNA